MFLKRCSPMVLIAPLFMLLLFMTVQAPEPVEEKQEQAVYFEVIADDERIGFVTQAVAEQLVDVVEPLMFDKMVELGPNARCATRVEVNEVEYQAKPLQMGEVLSELAERIEIVVQATAMIVDEQPVVVVHDKEHAQAVIEAVRTGQELDLFTIARREYGDVQEITIHEIDLVQDIEMVAGLYDPQEIVSVEQAVKVLLRGTDVTRTHIVQRGESMWSIASSYGITVDDLERANPDIENTHLIRPGDEVSLIVPKPYVNVVSGERTVYAEPIRFPSRVVYDESLWPWERVIRQHGIAGKRLITVEATRIDGQLIESEVIDEEVVADPRMQIIAQGSRKIPDLGTGLLIWPLQGRITSRFGWRSTGFHYGVDVGAPLGTPIQAADSGIVTHAGWRGAYGNLIIVDHGGGEIVTYYAHLSRLHVSVGDRVEKGQTIGLVGSTGRSTGPHLHFEVRLDGRAVDPIQFYENQVK